MEPAPAAAAEGQTWWPSDESIAAWGRWSTPAGMEPYPPLVAAHMEARYQLYRVADASTHTADIGHGRFVDFAELRQVRYEDNSRWVAIVRHAPNCASCGAGQHSTAGPVCERCAGAAAPEAAGAGGTGAAGASESQASAGAGADAAGGGASSGGGGGGSALASVFMPQKKRPRLESEKGPDGRQADGWGVHLGMLLHYRSPQWAPGAKVAAFDFDNTLARGGFQIQSQPRAQPNFKTVFERLRRLVDAGYVLVIFSNQTSLGRSEAAKKKRNNINDPAETAVMTQKKKRFMSFVQQSKLPWRMFLAMGDLSTGYRKPCPGMWEHFLAHCAGGYVDAASSFFCGDAAGRPQTTQYAADHSADDRDFSRRAGLRFIDERSFFAEMKLPEWHAWVGIDVDHGSQ